MSKSGVPILSQAASIVDTVGNSLADIVSGKNVFEAIGRIVGSPIAAAGDLVNDLTFKALTDAPVVGQFLKGSSEFLDNPYSRDSALKLARGTGEVGATLAGGAVLAPAIGVSPWIGAVGTNLLVQGKPGDLLNLVGGSDLIPGDVKDIYNESSQFFQPKKSNQGPTPFIPPATTSSPGVYKPTQNSSNMFLFLALIGIGGFFILRRNK